VAGSGVRRRRPTRRSSERHAERDLNATTATHRRRKVFPPRHASSRPRPSSATAQERQADASRRTGVRPESGFPVATWRAMEPTRPDPHATISPGSRAPFARFTPGSTSPVQGCRFGRPPIGLDEICAASCGSAWTQACARPGGGPREFVKNITVGGGGENKIKTKKSVGRQRNGGWSTSSNYHERQTDPQVRIVTRSLRTSTAQHYFDACSRRTCSSIPYRPKRSRPSSSACARTLRPGGVLALIGSELKYCAKDYSRLAPDHLLALPRTSRCRSCCSGRARRDRGRAAVIAVLLQEPALRRGRRTRIVLARAAVVAAPGQRS